MKKFFAVFIFLLFAFAAQAAAQETQMSITIQPASSITSNGETVYPTQSESYQFQADEGGTFNFANADGSSVKIIFFIGTTQVTLDFFIDSYDKSAIIAGRPLPVGRDVVGGLIYDMRTFENISETMTFDNPFSMTVGYSEAQIGSLEEESLNIYFWNENNNAWETFATSTLNTADNTITILSNHLTLFATLGETKEDVSSETEGSVVIPAPAGGGSGGRTVSVARLPEQLKQPEKKFSKVTEPIMEYERPMAEEEELKSFQIPSNEILSAPAKIGLFKFKAKEDKESKTSATIINPAQAQEVADEEEIPRELLDIEFQLDKETSQKERDNTPIIIGASAVAMSILAGIYILRKR